MKKLYIFIVALVVILIILFVMGYSSGGDKKVEQIKTVVPVVENPDEEYINKWINMECTNDDGIIVPCKG